MAKMARGMSANIAKLFTPPSCLFFFANLSPLERFA
jgi:hypothetical protein